MTYVIKEADKFPSGLNLEQLDTGEIRLVSVCKEGSKVKEWAVTTLSSAEEKILLEVLLKRQASTKEVTNYADVRRSLYTSNTTVYSGVCEPITIGLVVDEGEYIPVVYFTDADDVTFRRDFYSMEAAVEYIKSIPNPVPDTWLDEVFYSTEWS
jgi:hypothetical protein